jgi:hypothetical protein
VTGSIRLPVRAELTLAPFDADPLPAIALRIEGLDLNTLLPAAPATAIEAEFKGAAQGTDAVSGTLNAVNAREGTLDQKRLPLRTLASHVTLTRQAVVLEQARLSLGTAGAALGSAHVDATGIAVDLTTGDLDLRGLHAALTPTRLAGSVRAQVESARQLVSVDLRQDKLRVQAEAAIADGRLTLTQFAAQAAGASLRGSGEIGLAGEAAFSAQTVLRDFDPARCRRPSGPHHGELAAHGQLRPTGTPRCDTGCGPAPARPGLGGQGQLTLAARSAGRRRPTGPGRQPGAARQLRPAWRCARLRARRAAAGGVHRDLAGSLRAGGLAIRPPPELDATLEGSELLWRLSRGAGPPPPPSRDGPSELRLTGKLERPAAARDLEAMAVTPGGHAIAPCGRTDGQRHGRGSACAGRGRLRP